MVNNLVGISPLNEARSPACEAAWQGLRDSTVSIHVPGIWLWEVTNILWIGEKRSRITHDGSKTFLRVVRETSVLISHSGMNAVFDLVPQVMRKHGLTSYDAAYLLLAAKNELPLATLDDALKKAAKAEGIPVVS